MRRRRGSFGLSLNREKRGSAARYGYRGAGSWRGGRGRGRDEAAAIHFPVIFQRLYAKTTALYQRKYSKELRSMTRQTDEKMGFARVQEGARREGWLINMRPTLAKDPEWPSGKAAVDFYFIQDDGGMFRCTFQYEPYFCIACKQSGPGTAVEEWLRKKYEGTISRIVRDKKEDLKLPNHLMGHRRLYLQLCFRNVSDLLAVRRDIVPLAQTNGAKRDAVDAYAEVINATTGGASMDIDFEGDLGEQSLESSAHGRDPRECIIDVREYDVPYYLRVAIDNEIRVGLWYAVTFNGGQPSFSHIVERVKRVDPVVMAFDIDHQSSSQIS
ncbi:hypothetical protein D9756_007255 [Leucocoprinus leucothites]|uniref:DNA polymerase epsilon catalytic subunit n=1 Tax=Leucocoprinus leucothites TaxID=201217 RepID=A0A8H5FYW5_9AGAR|nr:hypothetical protein D9756_007255 [Leucoagaricus leucothites]